MGRIVCLNVNGHIVCSGSPIRDCSCDRDVTFKDIYPETPERIDDPARALEDVKRVFDVWSKSGDSTGRADKLYALSAIARLILTPGISLAGPFVISSMENGTEPPAQSR